MKTWTGGCLCGAIRYEATPEKSENWYCHCRMCQRWTGFRCKRERLMIRKLHRPLVITALKEGLVGLKLATTYRKCALKMIRGNKSIGKRNEVRFWPEAAGGVINC